MTVIGIIKRKKLAELFEKWADEKGVEKSPLNCVSFLVAHDLICPEAVLSLIAKEEEGK